MKSKIKGIFTKENAKKAAIGAAVFTAGAVTGFVVGVATKLGDELFADELSAEDEVEL